MEKKSSENYARSFLKSGHSLFRTLLRKSMVGKFSKFLYLDFKIRNLFSTLIVLPRSFFLKFFWEDIKADRELASLANLKLVRQDTAICFKECTLEKQYIESATKLKQYLSSDYGLIDQFYWILQYQRLEDFVQGLTDCFKIYDVTCEGFDIVQFMDNVIRYTHENSDSTNGVNEKNIEKFVKKITKKYIVYFDNSIKEESLKKQFQRNSEKMKKLYAFYEQGLRCYRNQLNGMDDFEMVRFFYYSRNGMDKILNGIRTIYIRSVLAIIFIALGKKNIFPTETKESQKQKNRGLYSIIDDYDEFISDFDFSTNGTYYLIWNFINEIIEWGFCEAKIVNDFRKNVILPYYKWKGLGLKNNDENVMPLTMDKIRDEIIEICSKTSILVPPFNPEDPMIPLLRFKDFR